jgi:hypothetical protein
LNRSPGSVVSCCDLNFGAGSYMNGSCAYVDACSTPVPSPSPVTPEPTPAPVESTGSPHCAPGPLSPIDIEGKKPTNEPTEEPSRKPTPFPSPAPTDQPATAAPTSCLERPFFFYGGVCTNLVYSDGAVSYSTASDCCDANVAIGSLMNGRCQYEDMCKEDTAEPTPSPSPAPTDQPVTAAPTSCLERPFFFYGGVCTNLVYSDSAELYSTASDCCDANVAIGSLMNGRCQYEDMCNVSTEQPTLSPSAFNFPKDTLPPTSISIPADTPFPTAGIPINPDGSAKTIPPTPSPSMVVVKTYSPTPAPSVFDGEMPSTPAPTFGSTPTVGTSTTLSPVRERVD